MYTAHYNLSGRPFQLSPDHRFFYGSRTHKKALAYLTYGLREREGFIVITGDIGAGKTTLVRHLLSQIDRDSIVTATVVTSYLEADDALRMVVSAFGLPFEGSDKATLLRTIERFLVENRSQGRHVLLIVDEVQNMPFSALEELRMLSNFQHNNQPLFQCFLLGQPQFKSMLAHSSLEQLRQRVIASCHLEPLDAAETRVYIEHRLNMVGWANDPSFDDGAFEEIYRCTGGVPRRVNTLCSRILLFGYLEDRHHIDGPTVVEVVHELAAERGDVTDGTGTNDAGLAHQPIAASTTTVANGPSAVPQAMPEAAHAVPAAFPALAVPVAPPPTDLMPPHLPMVPPQPANTPQALSATAPVAQPPAAEAPVGLPDPGFSDGGGDQALNILLRRVAALKGAC